MNNTIDSLDVKKLHSEGKSNDVIAEELNCTIDTIIKHIKKLGLVKNKTASEVERLRLYKLGLTDAEIANRTFMSPGGIYAWRERLGLPVNKRKREA